MRKIIIWITILTFLALTTQAEIIERGINYDKEFVDGQNKITMYQFPINKFDGQTYFPINLLHNTSIKNNEIVTRSPGQTNRITPLFELNLRNYTILQLKNLEGITTTINTVKNPLGEKFDIVFDNVPDAQIRIFLLFNKPIIQQNSCYESIFGEEICSTQTFVDMNFDAKLEISDLLRSTNYTFFDGGIIIFPEVINKKIVLDPVIAFKPSGLFGDCYTVINDADTVCDRVELFVGSILGNNITTSFFWANVSVPEGSKITLADVVFEANGTQSSDVNATIFFHNNATSHSLENLSTNFFNLTLNRPPLTIFWDIPDFTFGELISTPELLTLVENITNGSDWRQFNGMHTFIETHAVGGTNDFRRFRATENPLGLTGSGLVPLFQVFYDDPPAGSPNITNITSFPSIQTSEILWNTSLRSNSSVTYGLTINLSSTNEINDNLTEHSRTLTGLTAFTLYFFNVTSCHKNRTAINCQTLGPNNFTTLGQISEINITRIHDLENFPYTDIGVTNVITTKILINGVQNNLSALTLYTNSTATNFSWNPGPVTYTIGIIFNDVADHKINIVGVVGDTANESVFNDSFTYFARTFYNVTVQLFENINVTDSYYNQNAFVFITKDTIQTTSSQTKIDNNLKWVALFTDWFNRIVGFNQTVQRTLANPALAYPYIDGLARVKVPNETVDWTYYLANAESSIQWTFGATGTNFEPPITRDVGALTQIELFSARFESDQTVKLWVQDSDLRFKDTAYKKIIIFLLILSAIAFLIVTFIVTNHDMEMVVKTFVALIVAIPILSVALVAVINAL